MGGGEGLEGKRCLLVQCYSCDGLGGGPQRAGAQGTVSVLADFVERLSVPPIDPNMSITQTQINVPSTSASRLYAETPHVNDTRTPALVSPEPRRYQRAFWVRIDRELFRRTDCFSL